MRAIAKGAEAYIYEDNGAVLKVRQPKKYRQPELDQRLRRSRTKKEATAIEKCNEAGVPSPKLLSVNEYSIAMERIDGKRVNEIIAHANEGEKIRYAREMGELLAKIHAVGLCHGDYSPTNIIEKGGVLHIIDFGLCEFSGYYEKRAADLAVMHSALKDEDAFAEFIDAYARHFADAAKVVERFRKNQQRGRYKERDG
ncbi:MAG: KEOPS complex kinase/ATPase Bud32 [Candidatus Micrarchaeia archaeon]